MVETILIAGALAVLIAAGIILGYGMRKNNDETNFEIKQEKVSFDTKYDEITYLYNSGTISEAEYKEQIKHIIN